MTTENEHSPAPPDHLAAPAPQPPPPARETWPQRRFWLVLAALCGLALWLCLAILDEFLRKNVIAEAPWSDGDVYWKMAGRMAEGHWLGQTPFLSAPLYPYMLGIIRTLGGGLLSVYLVQIWMHLATAALLAWVTRLRFGAAAGLLAATLFLLLTEPAVSSTRIMANTVQLFLVVILWWRWAAAAQRDVLRWRDVASVGALIGLLALGYPPALLLVPIYGLWLWAYAGWRRVAVLRALLGVAAALLLISPATLHNLLLHGELIPITAHDGITLRQGNGPTAAGIGVNVPGVSSRRDRMHTDAAAVFRKTYGREGTWREIDADFRRQAIDYWLENPRAALTLFARKLYLYINARNYDEIMPTVTERELGIGTRAVLTPLAVPWLLGAALVGLIAVLRHPLRFAPEWILSLLPLAVVLAFFYLPRYRLPAVPLMCGLAAFALTACWRFRTALLVLSVATFFLPAVLYVVNRNVVTVVRAFDAPGYVRTYYTRAQSEALVQAGDRRAAAQEPAEAEQRYRAALDLWNENALAHQQLGLLYARQRKLDDAARELGQAVRLNPQYVPSRVQLYNVLRLQKRYADAAAELRSIAQLAPQMDQAHLALAWLLATCPDDAVRDGQQALYHSQLAQGLASEGRAEALDVLAAAFAELNRFDEAVETGSAAAKLARERQRDKLAADIAQRVAGYREHQPCRAEPRALGPR